MDVAVVKAIGWSVVALTFGVGQLYAVHYLLWS